MFGKVTISGKEVEFLATASTRFRVKSIFGIDLFSVMSHEDNENVDAYEWLAFVMAKQAEHADLSKLTLEDYCEWADTFEPLDLDQALPEIVKIFMANQQTTSDPK